MATATSTSSPPPAMTTRSPGTRTTAARTSPPTPSPRRRRCKQCVCGGCGRRRRYRCSLGIRSRRQHRLVRKRRQPELHHHDITLPAAMGPAVCMPADVDGDGDIDVLSASSSMTTRLPGMKTMAARTSRRPHYHASAQRGRQVCLRRTWTATATSTSSLRPTSTTRSPGTKTTATRTSPPTPSPPRKRADSVYRGGCGRRWRPRCPLRVRQRRPSNRLVREPQLRRR